MNKYIKIIFIKIIIVKMNRSRNLCCINMFSQEITEERTLLQFHYTEWHSHTCPFGNAVLEFRRRVRAVVGSTIKNESGPMVVHCK